MVSSSDIDLDNPEFQNLLKLINYTNSSVFLTGKAGTGKSTFLKYITEHTKKNHVVLAPTGIAAVNVGGMTLHSFFNIPFKPLVPDDPEFAVRTLRKRMKYSREKKQIIKNLELIIIDEISMVRADIIDFVDKILRVYSHNMREPFGGKQLLLVGDMFQLEPVVTADMRDILRKFYPNSLFFSANVFRQMSIVSIELTKVYRQDDSVFISLLDRIRTGSVLQSDIDMLNRRLKHDDGKSDPNRMTMTLAARRETVDYINESFLDSIDKPMMTYLGTKTGDFPENSLPTALELQLKEGAQVVFIKNDREQRWVNGTLGKVITATDSLLEVQLESGQVHEIEPETWSNVKYTLDQESGKITEKVIGQFTQFPLRLAWALTIHKSQGLTFNNVDIDLGQGAFSSGQTYVALSRCRSLEGLGLKTTVSPRDVFINPAIVNFSRSFNDERALREAFALARADDCYHRSARAFDDGDYIKAFDLFVEATSLRSELKNVAAMRLVRRKLRSLTRLQDEIAGLRAELDKDRERFEKLAREYVSMGYDCLEDANDPLPALANFEKALSLSPENLKALKGKAAALEAMGEHKEAEKVQKLIKKLQNGRRKKK